MRRLANPHFAARALGPAQRWLIWMVVQGLLALSLAAGPAALLGPLHWHDGAASSAHRHGDAPGAAARHQHDSASAEAEGLALLEPSTPAAEELASAAAVLAPMAPTGLQVPRPALDRDFNPLPAATWQDAELQRPKQPPRA
jgi:hypothetical protein